MIRSSAQPSTKACASSALANETCAICACLRCRTFTCGAATTTTLMRRRGDSRPRQRGGQAYLHTAVAPDDSLDAPFGRTRREGDLDPAGPHGSCQKGSRPRAVLRSTSRTFSETHTADAPLMSIRLTFVHENFLGDLGKKFFSHLSRRTAVGHQERCRPLDRLRPAPRGGSCRLTARRWTPPAVPSRRTSPSMRGRPLPSPRS